MSFPFKRGDKIGRYYVLDVLGSGAMGVVCAAYDSDLDRKIAIKLLRPGSSAGQDEARGRLLREAQAMARLSHPNVVTVHDVGVTGGHIFVAMEYVDASLKDWMREPHSQREIIDVFIQAAKGLSAAHQAGMVHRDFKPANALISKDGVVRVTDFGLVASSAEPPDAPMSEPKQPKALGLDLTRAGALLGTPYYMAPEQYLGQAADSRADQFAFCVSLYAALYRQRPFAGGSVDELKQAVLSGDIQQPPADSSVEPWLLPLLCRGMSREPADRFPSMDAIIEALEHDPLARQQQRVAGEALLAYGLARSESGDGDAAEVALRKAVEASRKTGDPRRAIESLTRLVYVVGRQQSREQDALRIADEAQRAIEEMGGDDALLATLHNNRSVIFTDLERHADAAQQLRLGLKAAESAPDDRHGELAVLCNNLGNALYELGEHREAHDNYVRALAVALDKRGEEDKEVASAHEGLAMTLAELGEHEQACVHYAKSLPLWQKLFGDDNLHVSQVHSHYGWSLKETGKYDEALVHMERTLAILEAADNPQLVVAQESLANTLMEAGSSCLQRSPPAPAEAAPMFERAVELMQALEAGEGAIAYAKFASAVALWESSSVPEQRARALQLGAEARAGYRAAGPDASVNLAQVEEWLGQRSSPAN